MGTDLDLCIVGGGPAGLARAFWARRAGRDVTVLEAADRPGGHVRTAPLPDGHHGESGPQGVRRTPAFDALVEALGLERALVPAAPRAKRRMVGRAGRCHALPLGPLALLRSPLLSARAKLRLLREPFAGGPGPDDESVAAFLTRRFGPAVEPLAGAMVRGIFAGDAHELEVQSAFPTLAELERTHGSVLRGLVRRRRTDRRPARRAPLWTFTSGMATLPERLAEALGDRLRTGCPVTAIRRAGRSFALDTRAGTLYARSVVVAVPARAAKLLLRGLDPELADELAAIPFASVANVFFGFAAEAGIPEAFDGFGFLLEPTEPGPVLGAMFVSAFFPDHAPRGRGLIRVLLGGTSAPTAVDRSDQELFAAAEGAVRRYTGFDAPLERLGCTRARAAIPQYVRGHHARLTRIAARLARHDGLLLAGNSYRGVALTAQLGPGDDAVLGPGFDGGGSIARRRRRAT